MKSKKKVDKGGFVIKQIYKSIPEHKTMSKKALTIVESLAEDLAIKILVEAMTLADMVQRKAVGVRQVRAALDLILPHAHSKDLLDSLDSHIETSSRPTPKNAPKIEPRPMRNDLFAYQFKHLSKPKLGRYFTLAPAANTLIAVAVQQVVLLVLEGGVTNMKWDIRKSLMPEDLMMSIWHNDLLSELFHNTLLASTGVPCGFPNAPKHKPTKPLAKETEAAEPFKPIVPQ